MSIIHVSAKDFEEVVVHSSQPVLVDFWANWCGPCQMLAPTLEELVAEDDLKIAKVDVDKDQELAISFGIVSIPTLLVFKDGKITNKSVGLVDKATIRRLMA